MRKVTFEGYAGVELHYFTRFSATISMGSSTVQAFIKSGERSKMHSWLRDGVVSEALQVQVQTRSMSR